MHRNGHKKAIVHLCDTRFNAEQRIPKGTGVGASNIYLSEPALSMTRSWKRRLTAMCQSSESAEWQQFVTIQINRFIDCFIECLRVCLLACMIDSLIHWFIDSLIDSFIPSLIHPSMHACMHACNHSLVDWLTDWSIEGLKDWWIDRLIDRLIDSLIHWSMDWSISLWLSEWLPCALFHGLNEKRKEQSNQRLAAWFVREWVTMAWL